MKERDLFQKINDFIREFDERAGRAVKQVVLPATLGLGLALGTGCGPQDDPGQTRPPVTRAQKGDTGDIVALYAAPFPGDADSCKDLCGGQAPAGCWCDDECATYGDCCDDKAALCDVLEPPVALYAAPMPQPEYAAPFPEDPATCVSGDTSYCGQQAPAGCWCDDQCATYGDCCDDKAVCEVQALYAAPFPADEP